LSRLRDKIVALDVQIASTQKHLNNLRSERGTLDDKLLAELAFLNQEELPFGEEVKPVEEPEANPDLKLPENEQKETETVQCGMCAAEFPVAEYDEPRIEEGFAYERAKFQKDIKKKFPKQIEFVCGKCYCDKLDSEA